MLNAKDIVTVFFAIFIQTVLWDLFMNRTTAILALLPSLFGGFSVSATELTVATFNVSMEAENYVSKSDVAKGEALGPQVLASQLKKGDHPQIRNIAAIIQQVQPDIILLNEFDYIADPAEGVQLFIDNYLAKSQQNGTPHWAWS